MRFVDWFRLFGGKDDVSVPCRPVTAFTVRSAIDGLFRGIGVVSLCRGVSIQGRNGWCVAVAEFGAFVGS